MLKVPEPNSYSILLMPATGYEQAKVLSCFFIMWENKTKSKIHHQQKKHKCSFNTTSNKKTGLLIHDMVVDMKHPLIFKI